MAKALSRSGGNLGSNCVFGPGRTGGPKANGFGIVPVPAVPGLNAGGIILDLSFGGVRLELGLALKLNFSERKDVTDLSRSSLACLVRMLFSIRHLSPARFCQCRRCRSRCRQRRTCEWSSPCLVCRFSRSQLPVQQKVAVVEVVVVEAVVAAVAVAAEAAAVVVEAAMVGVAEDVARWDVLVSVPELVAAVAVADRLL